MEKGGDDDLLTLAALFGEVRSLQHVFGHRHGFAEVFLAPAPFEDIGQKWNDGLACEIVGHAASRTERVESSPSLSA